MRKFRNKNYLKLISLALCFACFLSFGNVVNADISGLGNAFNEVYEKIMSGITDMLVSFGDGVMHILTISVGETVTIDKLVFNNVERLSIDYWNDDTTTANTTKEPIKAFMSPVVEKWYAVFFKIAVMVYMVVLVYIGISIMLSSTADKKASFKESLSTWILGITILFMFPYVMKYIILLNDAVVKTLHAKSAESTNVSTVQNGELVNKGLFDLFDVYGKDEFVDLLGGTADTDMMVLTRSAARNTTEDNSNMGLAIAYLILIGQMIAILVMYYKRAFMVAFLITIFPLVAMIYVVDKLGDKKSQSFGLWFKEFVVNVIIQMFHAVVYMLITGAGINSYISSGGKNFVFMILCVLFLFEGEKILRNIFNIKSGANTITDLAASGAMVFATAKSMSKLTKKGSSDVGNEEDKTDVKNAENRVKAKSNAVKAETKAAEEDYADKVDSGESTESHGEYQNDKREPKTVSRKTYDEEKAKASVLSKAMKRKLTGGALTKGVNMASGAVGATLGVGMSMADGKSGPDKVITSALASKSMAQTLTKPVSMVANKVEQGFRGAEVKGAILAGKLDKELGIDDKYKLPVTNVPDGVDVEEYMKRPEVRRELEAKQEIYRRALAEYASTAATKGKQKAEVKYYEYLEKNLKK